MLYELIIAASIAGGIVLVLGFLGRMPRLISRSRRQWFPTFALLSLAVWALGSWLAFAVDRWWPEGFEWVLFAGVGVAVAAALVGADARLSHPPPPAQPNIPVHRGPREHPPVVHAPTFQVALLLLSLVAAARYLLAPLPSDWDAPGATELFGEP